MLKSIILIKNLDNPEMIQCYCDKVNAIIQEEFGPVIAKQFAVEISWHQIRFNRIFNKLSNLRFSITIYDYSYYDFCKNIDNDSVKRKHLYHEIYEEPSPLYSTNVSYTGNVCSRLELKGDPRITREIIDASTRFCQDILTEHPFKEYLVTERF